MAKIGDITDINFSTLNNDAYTYYKGRKISRDDYINTSIDNFTLGSYIVNALEIDWNGAYLGDTPNESNTIDSTPKLLSYIKTTRDAFDSHSHSDYLTSLAHNHAEFATTEQLAHSHDLSHSHIEYLTSTSLEHSHAGYLTEGDLSSYLNSYVDYTYLNTTLGSYVSTDSLTTTLGSYYVSTDLLTGTLGSYVSADLLNNTLGSYVSTDSLTGTLSTYAPKAHEHTEYSLADHTHDFSTSYAPRNHYHKRMLRLMNYSNDSTLAYTTLSYTYSYQYNQYTRQYEYSYAYTYGYIYNSNNSLKELDHNSKYQIILKDYKNGENVNIISFKTPEKYVHDIFPNAINTTSALRMITVNEEGHITSSRRPTTKDIFKYINIDELRRLLDNYYEPKSHILCFSDTYAEFEIPAGELTKIAAYNSIDREILPDSSVLSLNIGQSTDITTIISSVKATYAGDGMAYAYYDYNNNGDITQVNGVTRKPQLPKLIYDGAILTSDNFTWAYASTEIHYSNDNNGHPTVFWCDTPGEYYAKAEYSDSYAYLNITVTTAPTVENIYDWKNKISFTKDNNEAVVEYDSRTGAVKGIKPGISYLQMSLADDHNVLHTHTLYTIKVNEPNYYYYWYFGTQNPKENLINENNTKNYNNDIENNYWKRFTNSGVSDNNIEQLGDVQGVIQLHDNPTGDQENSISLGATNEVYIAYPDFYSSKIETQYSLVCYNERSNCTFEYIDSISTEYVEYMIFKSTSSMQQSGGNYIFNYSIELHEN